MTKHVLIAEDDSHLADMMAKILGKKNVRVTITCSGKETLEALERQMPDVLLLDVLMPVMDGLEVLEIMKEKKMNCPIIVVSNFSDKQTKAKYKGMHVKKFCVKNDMDDHSFWPVIKKYLR